MSQTSREIQLAARPVGEPKQSDFRLAEVEVPDPGPGEVLVRNRWMSVDPYMRGRMTDRPSYVPPFQIGATLEGGAVGEVVASNAPELAAGTTVLHNLGWREYAVVPAGAATPVDTGAAPEQAFLGILGMPGLTAYVGLLDMAGLRDGDVVFVSGAAGAVGSLVGQIAKVRGHRVVGSAGSAEKVAFLTGELGFDAAFDYHDGDVYGAAARRRAGRHRCLLRQRRRRATSRRRLQRCARSAASRSAARSRSTTRPSRRRGSATSCSRWGSG